MPKKNKNQTLAVQECQNRNNKADQDLPEIDISETHQLLSDAQLLLCNMEALLISLTVTHRSKQRPPRMMLGPCISPRGSCIFISSIRDKSRGQRAFSRIQPGFQWDQGPVWRAYERGRTRPANGYTRRKEERPEGETGKQIEWACLGQKPHWKNGFVRFSFCELPDKQTD